MIKGRGQLVLSRRIAESIKIGDDIEIFVVDIDKAAGKVDLAISAPRQVKILKKENYLKDLQKEISQKDPYLGGLRNNGLSIRNKS